ncbi:T9SS type A sorting domain-containing protein [Hymenobacter sp. BRD67]|uniref:T9SS type A sorting domain-containing protein n=1 Tax=Hymenobacter sp. BRD67 TaxID=2675877 RepID=UPI001563DDAE|nr:T9SS type A sorting domain-containing protein [Hymenobacter sp. BRD67]QKG54550.1 T9SS type A sorting domain-containing protein [Hymenobacter sp. BRD67]
MQFYYKLTGPGAATDQAAIQVVLTRSVNGTSTLIGEADATLAPTTGGYTLGTLTLNYSSSALPDSVTIYAASGNAQTIQAGTALQLDDISFIGTGLAVRADAGLQAQLTVSPNPSPSGRFVISSPSEPALAAAPLTVLDALGREVLRQTPQAVPTGTRELDLSNLPLGIYLLRLDSKQGALVRQLVVK